MKVHLVYAMILLMFLGGCGDQAEHKKTEVNDHIVKPIVRPPGKAEIPGAPLKDKQGQDLTQSGRSLVPINNFSPQTGETHQPKSQIPRSN